LSGPGQWEARTVGVTVDGLIGREENVSAADQGETKPDGSTNEVAVLTAKF
jgi:hypothetical protein